MTTVDDATIRALIDGERDLRDGLDRADDLRSYGIRHDPEELARRDYGRGWRPHHYPVLLWLREYAIAIRSPLVQWGLEYPREFPWWPRSVTFDAWADAQTLHRTRTQTGLALKQHTKTLSGDYDRGTQTYREWGVDHAVSRVTLLVCSPARQQDLFRQGYRVDREFGSSPADGFTPDYTERLGIDLAPLVWAAGLPLNEALTVEPDRVGLSALAALRGYRFPVA